MSGRRGLTMRETVETLLRARQLRVVETHDADGKVIGYRAAIFCLRTFQEITVENCNRLEAEHWPKRHKHDGPVSPDNAIISLSEGHKEQTKREAKADGKERRVKAKALPKAEREVAVGPKQKWRWKRKVGGGTVRVRTR